MNKTYIKSIQNKCISTTTPAQKAAIGFILKQAGEKMGETSFDIDEIDYSFPNVNKLGSTWGGTGCVGDITFEQFIAGVFSPDKKTVIKLNDSYSAEFVDGDEFVTIGCQKFPVSVIKELAAKLS